MGPPSLMSFERKSHRQQKPQDFCCLVQCRVGRVQNAKSFCKTAITSNWVFESIVPSLLMRRDLSIVRIWSIINCPFFFLNTQETLVGYSFPAAVIGATMTVRMCRFISSGEIIKHGLAFWISEPTVGSKLIK